MTEKPPGKPVAKPDRLTREAAALRANLLKRKEQARKRQVEQDTPAAQQPPDKDA